jgi:O-antigen ligase
MTRLGRALEAWRSALAYLGLLLIPVTAYVGNLGFAPLVGLLGAGALVFLGREARPNPGMAILFLLLCWGLISMSWSPAVPLRPNFHRFKDLQSVTGLKLVFELALYGAFVLAMQRVDDTTAASASLIMAIALAGLAVLLSLEALDGARLYLWIKAAAHQRTRPDLATRNVARGCYVAAVLFWPTVLRLRRAHQSAALAVLVVGLGVSAFVFRVDSPVLAVGLSSAVFVLVRWLGPRAVAALLLLTVFYFAAAPAAAYLGTHLLRSATLPAGLAKLSWGARLDIWRFVSTEVMENPLTGWGLDSSRSWPQDIPLHPHDAALQTWLELGVPGVTLLSLFWAWLFTRLFDLTTGDRTMGAAASAAACAYLSIGALSFGVWQEWWLAVGALAVVTCGFVAASRRLEPPREEALGLLQPLA